jgi:hypothetical protein
MRYEKLLIAALLIYSGSLYSQVRISGFVRDSLSREVLVGAHVVEDGTSRAAIANAKGYFSITPMGKGTITISYVGYTAKKFKVDFANDTLVEVLLSPGNQIDEVVISHTRRPPFNVATLSQLELQSVPSLGAKPDVMKAIQLLPGIQTQSEGSSLVLVRGGNPGENLYLLDNVALIYVNHFGGFMSVFNPDMINSIDVYKGGFPAKYGGKLSAIMDISQREGNPTYTKGTLSLGLTDISASIEGPTPIANSTFIVTGRKTLTDPLMLLATSLIDNGNYKFYYGFHDINGKFTWRPNSKNSFSLNVYHGDDYLNVKNTYTSSQYQQFSNMRNIWGNWMVSAHWNRVHSPKLYSNQSLSYVRYRLGQNNQFSISSLTDTISQGMEYSSSVQDMSFRSGWQYELLPNWTVQAGGQATLLLHSPNTMVGSTQTEIFGEPTITSTESALYFENQIKFLNIFELQAGLRGVVFANKGFSHIGLEPRLNLDVRLNPKNRFNFSYMQSSQYSHLLFTSGEVSSNEVWVPSGTDIPNASTSQLAVGWKGNFANGMFDAETSFYHKKLSNLANYREGYTNLMGDGLWRNKVVTGGKGKAIGLEVLLRKNYGIWLGFVGYTWSHTTRQFSEINNGVEYLFEYDRPHSATVSISRKLTKKTLLTASWVYQTGLPFTPVIGRHNAPYIRSFSPNDLNAYEVLLYGEHNSARMLDYHRLDLGLQYNTHTRNGYKSQWTFSIYNAYNRQNPYVYFYLEKSAMSDSQSQELGLYQKSYFPIIPSFSYKIFFDKKERLKQEPKVKRPWYKRLFYH